MPAQSTPNTPYLVQLDHFTAIRLHGSNATTFLQGQLTCDVLTVTSNQGSLGACCDPKGRMMVNFFLIQMAQDYFLLLPKTMVALTLDHLKKYAVFSKVKLSLVTEWTIWEYYGSTLPHTHDGLFMIAFPCCASQWIIACNEKANDLLQKKQADTGKSPTRQDWQALNVSSGLVWLSPETSGLLTPQMIDLQKWHGVSFTKGCYVGQEIIARTEHLGQLKRHLYRANIQAQCTPQQGDKIRNANQETVGVIVEIADFKKKEHPVLAVIQDRALKENNNPTFYLHPTHHPSTADAIMEIKSHLGWMRCR